MRLRKQETGYKTKIGGQALIEGVMMRGIDKASMAVLLPDRTVDVETWDVKAVKKRNLFLRFPVVRGVVNLIESLVMGYKCLMKSAEKSGMAEEEDEQPGRFERFLENRFGEMAMNRLFQVTTVVATVIGVLLAVGLFIYLPALIARFFGGLLGVGYLQGVIEGVIKIAIFVLYLFLVSRMKEIRRVFEFHGAEHKTIACYEAGLPERVCGRTDGLRGFPKKMYLFSGVDGGNVLAVSDVVSVLLLGKTTDRNSNSDEETDGFPVYSDERMPQAAD